MNKQKKLLMSILISAGLVALTGCGGNSGNADNAGNPVYRVAISQYVEHPSLDATREGFIDALKDAGIEEGTNLKLNYNNAQNDPTNNLSIAQKLAGEKHDLIYAIATPSAQALVQQEKEDPILFAAVTDPVASELVDKLDKPSGNVTGASDTNPEAITQLMDYIAANFPDVANVGIIINEGESNAVIMSDYAEAALGKHNIKLVKAPVMNTSEVKQAVDSLVGKVDALFITLDNTVVSGVDAIIQAANEHDIPFFSSDRDTVEKGAFATVGFKYYDHGYEAGLMAVEMLKDGKKPSDLAVTAPTKLDFILNLKAAAEQGIEVTDAMKEAVKDPENNIIE